MAGIRVRIRRHALQNGYVRRELAILFILFKENKGVERMTDQPEWKPVEKTMNENFKEVLNKLQKILQNTECPKETRLMYYEQVQNFLKEQLDDIVVKTQSKKLLLKTIEDWKMQGIYSTRTSKRLYVTLTNNVIIF